MSFRLLTYEYSLLLSDIPLNTFNGINNKKVAKITTMTGNQGESLDNL